MAEMRFLVEKEMISRVFVERVVVAVIMTGLWASISLGGGIVAPAAISSWKVRVWRRDPGGVAQSRSVEEGPATYRIFLREGMDWRSPRRMAPAMVMARSACVFVRIDFMVLESEGYGRRMRVRP